MNEQILVRLHRPPYPRDCTFSWGCYKEYQKFQRLLAHLIANSSRGARLHLPRNTSTLIFRNPRAPPIRNFLQASGATILCNQIAPIPHYLPAVRDTKCSVSDAMPDEATRAWHRGLNSNLNRSHRTEHVGPARRL